MSGGSATSARVGDATTLTCAPATLETRIKIVGTVTALPAHALKQPAMLAVPSGQQGHGFESLGFGIESAQGISVALTPTVDPDARAVTTGADSSSCAATSTYIRGRMSRRFTVLNIDL